MKQYYITGPNTHQSGPFDEAFIREQYAAGAYEEGTHIWTEGMKEWLPIASVIRPRKPEKPTMPTPPKKPVARVSQILDSVPQPIPPQKPVPPVPPTPSPQREAPIPPPHQEEDCDVMISEGGQQRGPFSVTILRQMCKQGEVSEQALYWMPGMTDWKPISELLGSNPFINAYASFNKTLPKLQGFSIQRFFSEVFKHHKREEIDAILCCGTEKTMPHLLGIDTSWPSPWLFARFLLLCIASLFGFYWLASSVGNLAFPGFAFAGTVGLPVCAFLLLFEMNVRRDVSLHRAITALLMGGLLSLIITTIFNNFAGDIIRSFGRDWRAIWAGPIEEAAKLLTVILITSGLRNGRILTGIVMGAAVGTGFAIFETAGYLFDILMESRGNIDAVIGTMLVRAIGAWSGHTVYSAITAGAFWMLYNLKVKEGERSPQEDNMGLSYLSDKRFLMIAAVPVLLHMFHNSPLFSSHYLLSRAFADTIGWIIVLRLTQMGLHQIREEQEKKQRELHPNVSPESI